MNEALIQKPPTMFHTNNGWENIHSLGYTV